MAATANDRTALARSHEGPFVQPSSYLRPRGLSHPMASAASAQSERAIDREERQGLVSLFFWFCCRIVFFPASPRDTEREGQDLRGAVGFIALVYYAGLVDSAGFWLPSL